MSDFFERRTAHSANWSLHLSRFAAVLMLVSGAGHRAGFIETPPFLWLLAIVVGLVALSLMLAARGFYRVWEHGDRGARSLSRGFAYSVLVLIPFGISAWYFYSLPRLNDISTDLVDPPGYISAAGKRTAEMNPIAAIGQQSAEIQINAYPDVTGRRYEAGIARVVAAVDSVIAKRRWPVTGRRGVAGQDQEVIVEAVAHTFWLGFPADVVVRLTDEGGTTYVDMRSSSRYGLHDLGDNAWRIRFFLNDLDEEVANPDNVPEPAASEPAPVEPPPSSPLAPNTTDEPPTGVEPLEEGPPEG